MSDSAAAAVVDVQTINTRRGKVKIDFIDDRNKRNITFSKRKQGLMKKFHELTKLTGTEGLCLVVSDSGHIYTFATPKLNPIIHEQAGRDLIYRCLSPQ